MMLKNFLVACFGASLLTPTISLASGGSHGGGGVGVRCLGPSGRTLSFEMLDIYEARARGVTLRASPHSEADAIKTVVELTGNYGHFPDAVETQEEENKWAAKEAKDYFEGLPEYEGKRLLRRTVFGGPLPLSNDFGGYSIAPNCHLEQVAYSRDQDLTMRIAKAKWKELNWLNRIALIAHEGIYSGLRDRGVEYLGHERDAYTSALTRRFVGDFLSVQGVVSKADSIPSESYVKCEGANNREIGTDIYTFPTNGGTTFVFETLAAHLSPYQMKAEFASLSITSLLDIENGELQARAQLQFVGEKNSPVFILKINKVKGLPAELLVLRRESNGLNQVLPRQVLNCGNLH